MKSTASPRPPLLAVADLTGCRDLERLTPEDTAKAFVDVLTAAGATIVETMSHAYPGQGLTCVAILQESHAVLHTWPETGTVHVDIFSCSGSLDARGAIAGLGRIFAATRIDIRDLPRAGGSVVAAPSSAAITPALAFVVRALVLSVALFGLLRLGWVEQHVLWPFTTLQATLAASGGGGAQTLARVGLSCSGADALALALSVILVWPVAWRPRLIGAVLGFFFIVSVNIVRIVTLVRVVDPWWFNTLHVYVWPAVLVTVVAGYVFVWMRLVEPAGDVDRGWPPAGGSSGWRPLTRFAVGTVAFSALFFGIVPLYLESAPVVALAGWMAGIAATLLGWQGVVASTSGSVLVLARGAYQVTGECIATPVIPVGVAAALAMPWPWGRRALALLAVGPIFVALGIARLLVLAIPTAIADAPLFWTHAFFQLLTALVAVVAVVVWRHREDSRWSLVGGRALIAAGVGLGVAVLFGFRYAQAVQDVALTLSASWIGSNGASLVTASDPQRALMLLPPFQLGLFVALAIAGTAAWNPKRWAGALGVLVLSQVLLFVALHGMAASSGLTMPVPGVRAWAVGAPLVLLFVAGPLSVRTETSGYQGFWEEVGREFPDLAGASSTEYYFDNETRLLSEHLPTLRGIRILKTDLWDEAKNTRILQWAARQGAQAFGVDISHPIAQQARHQFVDHRLGAAAADVRHLPFADGQFDAIYSMGTIEHFDDSDVAVAEMFRVLKPGGRAIVGVPNRADPFLRPALVYVMQRVGAYGYGAERSFSRRALNRMLTSHGFDVVAETGILFMPGWLRMLDLACHSWCRPLTPVTRAMVAPFRFLDGRLRGLRRHGYLLATVAVKPDRRG